VPDGDFSSCEVSQRILTELLRGSGPKDGMTRVELGQFTMQRLFHCTDEQLHGLAELLIDCVDGGARALLVAEDGDGVIGTVQLILDQPENQPHRADISKMLVHRRARRRGVGAALLQAAEDVALECGKWL
jgi:GNAT superfamily N-acetyltransferase